MPKTKIPSRQRGTIAFRLSDAERRLLETAAALRPERVTTYIREAALEVARRELASAADDAA